MDRQERQRQSYLKISRILQNTQEKVISEIVNITEREDLTNSKIDQALTEVYDMCKKMPRFKRIL